jgi:hypothetical protein
MSTSFERNKGYALGLLAGALVLLALSTSGLEGRLLSLSAPSGNGDANAGAAVDRFGGLFSAEPFSRLLRGGEKRDVFLTTYFNKPPAPPPSPPKPKTRSVALTYLGTLESSSGESSVYLRVDDAVKEFAAGDKVLDDWAIATVGSGALALTNHAGTNALPFRQTVQLTVPIP